MEGEYVFRVRVYMEDVLVRNQTLPATRTEPVRFEVAFPPTRGKIEVRCRVELLINGEFVESGELPLSLYPAPAPYPERHTDKTLWVYDTSGKLQRIFANLGFEAVDATFQPARNFGTPEIVFIGEDLDPNSVHVINRRLDLAQRKYVTVFLRQKRLPPRSNAEMSDTGSLPQNFVCKPESPLLKGLGARDLMGLADDATCLRIRTDGSERSESHVTVLAQDKNNLYSYLCTLEQESRTMVFCQFRVTDHKDPRCGILLRNLLELADEMSDSEGNEPDVTSERGLS
jgi:hypothetical protein